MRNIFRIFYSTTYTVLFIFLLLILAITPADLLRQSISESNIQNSFIIAGVYVLTAILTLFVYASRLYTNKTVLAGIPKFYVPVEPGEVGNSVRHIIKKNLDRSASIAFQTRPRDIRAELANLPDAAAKPADSERPPSSSAKLGTEKGQGASAISPAVLAASWGRIAHSGWSSPSAEDIPNLQFTKVVKELPNLIEAKAVSLAPPEPILEYQVEDGGGGGGGTKPAPRLPDARAVALLQRPATMGLRDYLAQLSSFGLLKPPSLGTEFLAQYEHARFSALELTEEEFRDLMETFAAILSGMTELDTGILDEAQSEIVEQYEGRSQTPSSSASDPYRSQGDRTSGNDMYESQQTNSPRTSRVRSESLGTVRTAPSRAFNPSTGARTARETSSLTSLSSVRRTSHYYNAYSSSSSLQSAQSVIRLNPNHGPGQLPYEYNLDGG